MYEKLIMALRTCVDEEKGCDECPYYEKCMTTVGKHAAMVDAADVIEKLQGRWIPVTEQLPENIDKDVLVCTEDYGVQDIGFVTTATYSSSGWLESWNRETYLEAVTHWMPLPMPPKRD